MLPSCPKRSATKGGWSPHGRILLIDTEIGRIVRDEEQKHWIATEHPYRQWLKEHMVSLEDLLPPGAGVSPARSTCGRDARAPGVRPLGRYIGPLQQAFGYTFEEPEADRRPYGQERRGAGGLHGERRPLGGVLRRSPNCCTATSLSCSRR